MATKAGNFVAAMAAAKAQQDAALATRPILNDGNGEFLAEVTDDGRIRLADQFIKPSDIAILRQFIIDNFVTQV